MKREEMLKELEGLFQDVFDDEEIRISEETTSQDIEGWDSLMHITLISEIEEKFDITFPMKEVGKLQSIKDILNRISELSEE